MGVYLEPENYDILYKRGLKQNPIIINDIEENTEEDKENFNKLIYTTFKPDDLLTNIPSCPCRATQGEFEKGNICPECHEVVTNSLEEKLEPRVWIRAPVGVRALINPLVWTILSDCFKTQGFDVIRWMCDKKFIAGVQEPRVLPKIIEFGIPRGLNSFHDNFDLIIELLSAMREYKKKKEVEYVVDFIKMYRDCVFCQHIPLINRSILAIDKTTMGVYSDSYVPRYVDAIRTMVGIDALLNTDTVTTKESRAAKTIHQIAFVYSGPDGIYRDFMGKKEGLLRKHNFGTRAHFAGRGVISSITGPHREDELHISWPIGLSIFEIHIINYLFRLGLTLNEAKSFIYAHTSRYHVLLDNIFKTIIAKSPDGLGCHVVWTRNPTLGRGSCQGMYITMVKTDLNDPTIGTPITNVRAYNADL